MTMSKLAVKVARTELQNRGFTVRFVRDLGRFVIKNPQQGNRSLYDKKAPTVFSDEELVVMAGSRVLDRFQARGGF